MRQDMHQLNRIRTLDISGQRRLPSRGNVRDLESLPAHQSMRSSIPHYTWARVSNYKPARRWLTQQVGRDWDAVYSELCARFDKRNTQQSEVLKGLLRQVDQDVQFGEDGFPYASSGWGTYRVCGLYVDPKTNVLAEDKLEGQTKLRAQLRQESAAKKAAECLTMSDTLQLRLVDGLWFWVELAEITEPLRIKVPAYVSRITGEVLVPESSHIDYSSVCRDVLSGQEYHSAKQTHWQAEDSRKAYGRAGVYAKRKWQASRRDVARHVRIH